MCDTHIQKSKHQNIAVVLDFSLGCLDFKTSQWAFIEFGVLLYNKLDFFKLYYNGIGKKLFDTLKMLP